MTTTEARAMNGFYKGKLPAAFPVCLHVTKREADRMVKQLIGLGGDPHGSSFAYTADGPYLWLSEASAKALRVPLESDALGRAGRNGGFYHG
ncbi:hypothetical protein [Mycolicibacterium sp. XJ870]